MHEEERAVERGTADKDRRIHELEARVADLEARQGQAALRVQSSTATELLKTLNAGALFKLVAERIYSIAQGAIVAFTEVDARTAKVVVRRVECPPADYQRIVSILGVDPVGLSLEIGDEARQRWKVGRLIRIPGGLHDLFLRQVPEAVCERLRQELSLGDAFGMACAADNDILGSVAVVSRRGSGLSNHALVEQLVAQAALGLKRIRSEESRQRTEDSLRESERRYRELAARLKEADRHKDEFLAMLAHELRNPLAVISSAAQISASKRVSGAAVERAREAMERQARHMARLIDDLLDVSRVTRGKVSLRREVVDLTTIVEGAVEIAADSIEAREQQLFVSLGRQSLRVDGDGVRLTQVLANILDNASKYTPRHGEIHISAEARGMSAIVKIRDNGEGIDAALLPRIFDLFVQGNRAADRLQGGLGIGLTMARSLVELHGGTIRAVSDGPRRGSEFTVSLPLVTTPAATALPIDQKDEPPEPRRILVVDDNRDAADMLRMWLELEGHEVVTANSGAEAIDLAVGLTPDVALIDLGMPGMDGYEVARRLRADARVAHTVLVALTGYGQSEDIENSRKAGFDHHVVKPAELADLRRVLAKPRTEP